jgi:hypothetical protein
MSDLTHWLYFFKEMIDKLLFLAATLTACAVSCPIFPENSLMAQSASPPAQPTLNSPGAVKQQTSDSYRLPSNKDFPREQFLTKEKFLQKLSKKAVLKSFEIMTYEDAMELMGDGLASDVSPERMVVVTEADFPNGLEANNADYSKATIISIRDAETEQLFGYSITGKIKKRKGIGATFNQSLTENSSSLKPSFCSGSKNIAKLECQQSE